MVYRPKQESSVRMKAFFITVVGVLLWMLSSMLETGRAIIALAAIAVLVLGLQYLIRYSLSEYRYVLDEESELVIYRTQGKRDAIVARIELYKIKELFKLTDHPDPSSVTRKTKNRFNYCQNPGKTRIWVLVFDDGDELIEVRFEPDEAFAEALRSRVFIVETAE